MNIGIVTITNEQNYGNSLQNYAVQEILRSLGHTATTLRHKKSAKTTSLKLRVIIKFFSRYKYNKGTKRIVSFYKFNKQYLHFDKHMIVSDDIDTILSNKYDVFVCGSDQIWNPNFNIFSYSYFLSFVKSKKKLAVSASFGVSDIKDAQVRKNIGKWLNMFDGISVREHSGKNLVENLSSQNAEVLIDPTLMLPIEKWLLIEQKPKKINSSNFILCYLLGTYENSMIRKICDYATNCNCKIIFLESEWNNLKFTSDEEFSVNPSEFIWLIHNAKKVITDSYHAVVFSLLFEKDFLVIPRDNSSNNMNSRFASLSKTFEIDNFLLDNKHDFNQKAIVNRDIFEKKLEEERLKFKEFLATHLCS